jgi:hypothetical protein
LFFQRKFMYHRMMGLFFLLQYIAAISLYFYDYEMFLRSPLIVTLPLTGICQTLTAIYTFTFLPKSEIDPGYYSDSKSITYQFIKENLFFVGLLYFQWLYYNPYLYTTFQRFYPITYCFVFLPYLIRYYSPVLFPKTRMRDAIENLKKNEVSFYFFFTWLTKIFYVWAKHYIGFFLNYLRFVDGASKYDIKCIFSLLLCSCSATTIAVFLHTLRFKGYIGPRVAFLTYVVAYMSTFIGYGMVFHVFLEHRNLFFVTLGGLIVNLIDMNLFNAYQVLVMIGFHFQYIS